MLSHTSSPVLAPPLLFPSSSFRETIASIISPQECTSEKGISCDVTGLIQSSPLIWSTDVRSSRLYGQFLAGPNHRTLILISNSDIRSARLYGRFSLDKTLTLQAGSTVLTTSRQSEKWRSVGTSGFHNRCTFGGDGEKSTYQKFGCLSDMKERMIVFSAVYLSFNQTSVFARSRYSWLG